MAESTWTGGRSGLKRTSKGDLPLPAEKGSDGLADPAGRNRSVGCWRQGTVRRASDLYISREHKRVKRTGWHNRLTLQR